MGRLERHLAEGRDRRAKIDESDWDLAIREVKSRLHPNQRHFVLDEGKRVAALVGRGGGKTTGSRARLFLKLLTIPKARLLYIATTRSQAEDLMWGPLKELIHEYGIAAKFNETKLKVTLLRTDAQLTLAGADDKRQIEKYRGIPFHEVVIDESASYPIQLLDHLINRVIAPRLGDYDGSLVLIGTPGHVQGDHPFYKYTRPGSDLARPYKDRHDPKYFDDPRPWSTHTWTVKDGADAGVPAMINLWRNHREIKAANGYSDKNPVWRREYLGEWALDDTENMYRYRAHLETGEQWNQWTPTFRDRMRVAVLPEEHDNAKLLAPRFRKREWRYVVGMDMGHSDPFSCQVFAYSPTDRSIWHVYDFEKRGMTIREIAQLLIGEELDHDNLGGLFGIIGWPDGIVADTAGLGGQVLAELSNVYGIHIEPADKRNKHDSIELFNGDLIDGRTRIMQGSTLEAQLSSLQWAVDGSGQLKEDKAQANHSADAAIYARRLALHLYSGEAPEPAPAVTPATAAIALDRQAEREEREAANPTTNEFEHFIQGPNSFDRFF